MISRSRVAEVNERLLRLGVAREDIEEEFVRGSGPGGQKINKTSSTVRLRHEASGVEVRCQDERSLAQNRLLARERLCEILEKRRRESAAAVRSAREKERRQKRQRSATLKRRLVADKRRHGETKRHRQKPATE